jgi:hypothetical protein
MGDTILPFEFIKSGDVGSTIVGNELGDGTISAEDMLKNKVHESTASLAAKHPSFRKRAEGAAGMYHI